MRNPKTILMRCRERMRSGDRLLLVEMVPVPGQPDVGIAILDIAMMMVGGEARQRTEQEYNDLFAATGFSSVRWWALGQPSAFWRSDHARPGESLDVQVLASAAWASVFSALICFALSATP